MDIQLSVEQLNNTFVAAQPYYAPVIAERAKHYNKIWGKLIQRGTFNYGEGYVKSKFQYHGGVADQSTSRIWQAMAASTPPNPSTGDPGTNACRYEASVIGYGIEQKQYTIYQTLRRTEDICLTDILFKHKAEKFLQAFMKSMADVTLGEWENFTRDVYVTFCEKVFCIEGQPAFTASLGCSTIDVSGVDVNAIGLLSQEVLDRMYQYLYREAAMGALAMKGAKPVFGIMSSAETLTDLIENDSTRRTDMRYANPNFLLDGIGSVDEYKSWSHMEDPQTIRFKLSSDGTTLIRVFPFKEEATTIGNKIVVDQEYIDAPFEISLVIVKDVCSVLVPPANPSFGSAQFDAIGNYGDFFWSNIKDRVTNPLGEIGYWLARFRGAPEPGDNSDRAWAILHRRNVGMAITLPDTCDTSPSDGDVNVTSAATLSAEDTYDRMIVVLAGCVNSDLGDTLVVTNGDSETANAVITNYLGGTSYELTFATDADWVTWLNTGSSTPKVNNA